MTDTDLPVVVLLASDLMLGSTISGYAASAGVTFRKAATTADVVAVLQQHSNILLLVDLGTPGLNVHELAASLPSIGLQNSVAYGPHVHEAKLQAATEAGFGQVMSRGQFSAQVGRLIAGFGKGVAD